MKKYIVFLLIFALCMGGCTPSRPTELVASTLAVYEFTSALCEGTGLDVSRLVTENISCLHDYSVQVGQMRAVESAEVVILNGAGLEDFLSDVLQSADAVIDASEGITLSCGHDHEGHGHEHDPHIWLSPMLAKQMCKNICNALIIHYPAYADTFIANLRILENRLDALQAYGKQQLSSLSNRNLITFHDGFSYFAESFDLHILKAIEEESGAEASAGELIEIIELMNSNSLTAIFIESNGSTAAAELIAAETGAKIYTLDMAMAGESYFDAMYRNIDTVKEALG